MELGGLCIVALIIMALSYHIPAVDAAGNGWEAGCKDQTIRKTSSTDGKTQTMAITCEVKQ